MTISLTAELWPDVQPETARRLMLAGVESFAARGYHATTTRDIASSAGMSPAALYVHFPSKAALLFAISRSGHEQVLALVEQAADARAGSPPAAMRAIVERFVAWHARRHTVARVVQYELGALPEDEYRVVADLRRRIEHILRDLIARGAESGEFRAEPKTAARAVLSLGIDVARWYTDRTPTAPDDLGRQYGELALRMLGAAVDS